jgi:hypothetical protein
LTRTRILFSLLVMKIHILAAATLSLSACNPAPPQNAVVQDVAANNMIADDVTEVQDDSASAPSDVAASVGASGNAQANTANGAGEKERREP